MERVRRGEPIRAEDLNALAAKVERVLALLGAGAGDARVELAQGDGRLLLGRVVRVYGPAGAEQLEEGQTPEPTAAGAVTYDVEVLSRGPSARLLNVRPDLGRPVEALSPVKVYAAAVGTRCVVVRFPDGSGGYVSYLILSERLAFSTC